MTTYVLPARVLILPEDLVPAVAELIQTEAKRLRRGEYGRPEPKLMAWLDDLEAVAAEVRRAKLAPHRVVIDEGAGSGLELIGTAEAAARLGVVETTLRRGPLREHAVGPHNRLLWPVDVIEAARRDRNRRSQNASECIEKASECTPRPARARER